MSVFNFPSDSQNPKRPSSVGVRLQRTTYAFVYARSVLITKNWLTEDRQIFLIVPYFFFATVYFNLLDHKLTIVLLVRIIITVEMIV